MRIGVDAGWLLEDQRGMGRYVRNILSHWRDEPDVVLFCRKPAQVARLRQEWPAWEVRQGGAGVDVCWFPWNRLDFDPGCPRVLTLHDVAPFHSFAGEAPNRDDQERFRSAARGADHVIFVTQAVRDEVAALFGVDGTVIPEGVDPVFLAAAGPRTVAEPYVLAIASADPRKNLVRLLESFPEVHRATGRRLVLAGSLPRPGLFRRDPFTAGPWALRVESPSDEELAGLFRHADAFVFPTLYEGFGLPLLEGLASGVPVAASRIPPLVEIGGDGPEWFDPRDPAAMAAAISRAVTEGRRLGPSQVEALLARFDWSRTARAVRELLTAVAAGRSPADPATRPRRS